MTLTGAPASTASLRFTLPTPEIDLSATLDGGQSFRWWPVATGESVALDGVIGAVAVRVSDAPDGVQITVRGGSPPPGFERRMADYLGLRLDLSSLRDHFSDDPCVGPAFAGFAGLRLLRQDPWECLASFICSATSNIPRIKLNVDALATELGERVGPGPHDFAFPSPAAVAEAGEQRVRDIGWGFRAKYLVPAAERIAAGEISLAALRDLSFDAARDTLTSLHGVGEKIADCVLAFSLDKPQAFPVDRHIRRALEKWYGLPPALNNSKASKWARQRFGDTGAIAQQYMFHRERLARRAADWGGSHRNAALAQDA